ncbi:SDR family oxidoreductase [Mycobacterium xenopi]|uniref:Short-chain dehydrogenase/reductas n=1 Tax=Mycobacterium xenopi TaxID=1789 RepID=A0AAD1LZV2_MYCXE|nr:SDR family oxidoreductase [Mycobacterium xenopi]EUA51252.1 short chain dehydrogenase family protein [Mycobacterium xenopi 3993]MDA3657985.1 SDR family oxidoreductase [Mycobacterium xenopi]MDA3662633.1 SDR family oxidoreductase [Mycobacterium xenopi]ORX15237.1 short-chain dehydrogenase [Mycobacterium xenopi]SPX78902.1 short chain dehydrogenase [Mycobacterium xenopi]
MTARRRDTEVLVVIGSGGMGLSIARRIGAGRVIVLADVDRGCLNAAADALGGDGHRVVTRDVDVTSRSSVAALAELAERSGRVTAVVHTAGLSPQQAPAETILAVDLLGVALVLDEFGKAIAPGGAGVVIASMAAYMYPAFDPEVQRQLATTPTDELLGLDACTSITDSRLAYPFAKRANQIRVAAAAAAWAERGARINCISPGIISTAMGRLELSGESGAFMQAMVDEAGLGRIGTPDDIAAAAEFLLGPSASFITGTDLLVDGGVVAALHSGTVGPGFDGGSGDSPDLIEASKE